MKILLTNGLKAQQYELGTYVNLMLSSTQLLVNPILGLQPKYSEIDYNDYLSWREEPFKDSDDSRIENLIICLCNLLYKIELNDRDKKLLRKSLKKNKEMLKKLGVKKKNVSSDVISIVIDALNYKYEEI